MRACFELLRPVLEDVRGLSTSAGIQSWDWGFSGIISSFMATVRHHCSSTLWIDLGRISTLLSVVHLLSLQEIVWWIIERETPQT